MRTYLLYTRYQNFTESIERKINCPFFYLFSKRTITITNILSTVKQGLQSYRDKVYSRSNINQMLILKTSKDLCVILILVLFRKFHLSKHLIFLHFLHNNSLGNIKHSFNENIHPFPHR